MHFIPQGNDILAAKEDVETGLVLIDQEDGDGAALERDLHPVRVNHDGEGRFRLEVPAETYLQRVGEMREQHIMNHVRDAGAKGSNFSATVQLRFRPDEVTSLTERGEQVACLSISSPSIHRGRRGRGWEGAGRGRGKEKREENGDVM